MSPRADEDEEPGERPEIQSTGDFVDLAVNDDLACARRASGPGECWGTPTEIADDVRAYDQRLAAEADEEWAGEEDASTDTDLASSLLGASSDLAMGFAGACAVPARSPQRAAAAETVCAGLEFENSAIDGIRGTEDVVEVCVGMGHACGRTSGGEVRCWGDNTEGQLGDGLDDPHADSAVRVRALDRVLHVACGEEHSCALRDDGSVWCWGTNEVGQVGQPEEAMESRVPVRIAGIERANAIVAGGSASCALFDEGAPRCWGDNRYGVLGDGTTRSTRTPVEASRLGSVRELALGASHGCAVRGDEASREILCWGLGRDGALGPRARRRGFEPVRLFEDAPAPSSLTVLPRAICIGSAEGLRCLGELGAEPEGGLEAMRTARPVEPGRLASLAGSRISLAHHLCERAETELRCRPTATPDAPPQVLSDVRAAAAGGQQVCVVHLDGRTECAVSAATGLRFVPYEELPPAIGLARLAGGSTCVLTRDGGFVVCDGMGGQRSAGVEPFPPPSEDDAGVSAPAGPARQPLVRFRDLEGVVELGAGGTLARTADGRLFRIAQHATPAVLLDRVESFRVHGSFGCARRIGDAGGEVWCWGANGPLLARREGSPMPVRIPGLEVPPAPAPPDGPPPAPVDARAVGVVELATSDTNACARLSDGRVMCWGEDFEGQLGRMPEALRLQPVVVLD
jgi:hypothetical protein